MLINSISTSLIRDYINDGLGVPTSIDNEGRILIFWPADKNFNHDMKIYFQVEDDNILRVFGFVPDFQYSDSMYAKALVAANEYNNKNNLTFAVATHSNIVIARNELLNKTVTDSFIKDSCIGSVIAELFSGFEYIETIF